MIDTEQTKNGNRIDPSLGSDVNFFEYIKQELTNLEI